MDSIWNWSVNWKLKFKESKCVLLRICRQEQKILSNYSTSINGKEIPAVSSHRELGILISKYLTWKKHHDHITNKAYRILRLLQRSFKNTTSTPQKKLLYISLVRFQLMYCSPLWRPYLIKDICKLENIQRRATKYVLNNYRDDYKSRLISLNLLPLMRQLEVYDILAAVTWFKDPGSHSILPTLYLLTKIQLEPVLTGNYGIIIRTAGAQILFISEDYRDFGTLFPLQTWTNHFQPSKRAS